MAATDGLRLAPRELRWRGVLMVCACPQDMRGPRGSRSNTKSGRDLPDIAMGDQIGRPHNLVPSYQDRSSFCAPEKVGKFKTNNTTELQPRCCAWTTVNKKIFAKANG